MLQQKANKKDCHIVEVRQLELGYEVTPPKTELIYRGV